MGRLKGVETIGATEAASRAGISRERMGQLLRQGRVVGARRWGSGIWLIPWPMSITGTRLSKLSQYAMDGTKRRVSKKERDDGN